MPRHFREITLRGRQRPAFPRTGTSKGVLRLRGPPGDLGNHSNRRMRHPRGWYLFGEKLEPFQIINTDGRRRPVAPCSSCSVWRCAYRPSAFALFAQTSSSSDLRSIGLHREERRGPLPLVLSTRVRRPGGTFSIGQRPRSRPPRRSAAYRPASSNGRADSPGSTASRPHSWRRSDSDLAETRSP